MTQNPGRPRLDIHGAVDLSALGRRNPPPGGAGPAGGPVVDVADEAAFTDVVQRSTTVPVVLVLWSARSEASSQVVTDLAALAAESDGAFLLARLDADASPQLAEAVGAQAVPTVLGVLRGQPVPLFQGPAAKEDIRALIDKLLELAAANQVTGRVSVSADPPPAEPEEPPLPPLHAEAVDAIDAGDLDGAADAYRRALVQNPRDDLAALGLAQVELLLRIGTLDATEVLTRAADPADLDAQLDLADLELASGRVAEAFDRLLAAVRRTAGAERDRVRERLVTLLGVVGDADPRVGKARRDLASALY